MNNKQIAIVLHQLHEGSTIDLAYMLNEKLGYFNLNTEQKQEYLNLIKSKYENGIKNLNKNQLSNIITKIILKVLMKNLLNHG